MKEHHKAGARLNARALLQGINAEIGQAFHTLSSTQIEALSTAADRARYQVPKAERNQRVRRFYDRVQRYAQFEL